MTAPATPRVRNGPDSSDISAPGTATAADELHSRMDLVELAGEALIDKRSTLRVTPGSNMVLNAGHLRLMVPKICEVLSEE